MIGGHASCQPAAVGTQLRIRSGPKLTGGLMALIGLFFGNSDRVRCCSQLKKDSLSDKFGIFRKPYVYSADIYETPSTLLATYVAAHGPNQTGHGLLLAKRVSHATGALPIMDWRNFAED